MIAEEESKRMLPAEDLREVAAPEHGSDETSPALGSPPVEPAHKNDDDGFKEESGLYRLYYGAQLLNILRYICVCTVLNFQTWIVAQGTTPKTSWIVLPWSAYSVGCVRDSPVLLSFGILTISILGTYGYVRCSRELRNLARVSSSLLRKFVFANEPGDFRRLPSMSSLHTLSSFVPVHAQPRPPPRHTYTSLSSRRRLYRSLSPLLEAWSSSD